MVVRERVWSVLVWVGGCRELVSWELLRLAMYGLLEFVHLFGVFGRFLFCIFSGFSGNFCMYVCAERTFGCFYRCLGVFAFGPFCYLLACLFWVCI